MARGDWNRQDKRNRVIYRLRTLGWTYGELALWFGVTRQRISQICSLAAQPRHRGPEG